MGGGEKMSCNLCVLLTAVGGRRTKQKMVREVILGVKAEFSPFFLRGLLVSKNDSGPVLYMQAKCKLVGSAPPLPYWIHTSPSP